MKTYFHKHVKIKHYKRALIKHMPCASSASLVAQLVNNLPTRQETWVRSLGWDDPLEKGMATHFSILAKSWTWLSNIHFHFHMCIFFCSFFPSIFFLFFRFKLLKKNVYLQVSVFFMCSSPPPTVLNRRLFGLQCLLHWLSPYWGSLWPLVLNPAEMPQSSSHLPLGSTNAVLPFVWSLLTLHHVCVSQRSAQCLSSFGILSP